MNEIMRIKNIENRKLKDLIASRFMLVFTIFSSLIVFLMIIILFQRSLPILTTKPLDELLFSSNWYPKKGEFGFFSFIIGTFWVTALAMIIAVPISLLTSIYLAEYAHSSVRAFIKPLIDLLAGIPSVVYGLWGFLVIVPLVADIAQFLGVTTTEGITPPGYSVLAGGIVLAIMVFPIIISVSDEVFKTVPFGLRETSLALGATKWQTVKYVVMQSALPGIFAAIIFGFSRAFGETMAVLMVVGNVAKIPSSVFDPAYPLPALIANNYGEVMSIPLYDSALLLAAFILLIVVLFFNIGANVLIKMRGNSYG